MIRRYRHAQLLAALVLLVVLGPFVDALIGSAITDLLLLLTMISAIFACSARRYAVVVGVTLLALVQGAVGYRLYYGVEVLSIPFSILVVGFVTFVTALVLSETFRDSRNASADTICGALAVYVLIGVAFAFGYALLEACVPGSISGVSVAGRTSDYPKFLAFSFVTLTTVGYGNVLPLSPMAESLAVTEAMLGQVYLTVLVARLVALNLASERERGGAGSDDQKQT